MEHRHQGGHALTSIPITHRSRKTYHGHVDEPRHYGWKRSIHACRDDYSVHPRLFQRPERIEQPVDARDADVVDRYGLAAHLLSNHARFFRNGDIRGSGREHTDLSARTFGLPASASDHHYPGRGVFLDVAVGELRLELREEVAIYAADYRPAGTLDKTSSDAQHILLPLALGQQHLWNAFAIVSVQIRPGELYGAVPIPILRRSSAGHRTTSM